MEEDLGWRVQVVQHPRAWERDLIGVPDPNMPDGVRFEDPTIHGRRAFRGVLPRWSVVERTFAWLVHSRRLARDYERLPSTDEALIYATMTRLMLRRLAHLHPLTPFSNSL